ncbi:peptidase inhibitor family I36 protein [Myceligenerans crystallogenes]|uniref:Peptidase inhibitor family I36 n=1 Tax=Myceligenerans crystallogenes TaxID=316335 RepID=A0ABP4ZT47_9MICO
MVRTRIRAWKAFAAGAALIGSLVLATALGAPAQAAARDGVCETGEFCYYFNSDHAGSVSDHPATDLGDYGTDPATCYVFRTAGRAGYGECIKNNAASVWNRTGKPVRVHYNSSFGGTYQEIAAGGQVNLNATLKNNNASHRFGPFVAAPSSRASYYVSIQDTAWAYDTGCSMGRADAGQAGTQTHVVVLAFGKTTLGADGVHRLSYFGGTDRGLGSAGAMAVAMGKGYDACTGADTASRLRVGLGTSNYPGSAVTSAAGADLARAARDAAADLASYPQATVWGANDFEAWGAGSGLNQQSRNWLDGYNAVSGRPPLVNFGSADGCPSSSVPAAGSCNDGLSADTIWYVSTRGAARPLPEIYTTSGTQAGQWKNLSLYAYGKGAAMTFPGVMAQHGACVQRGGCSGTDNTPATAWLQLNQQLDADSRTAGDPGAPTDIFWQESLAAFSADAVGPRSATELRAAWPAGIFQDAEAPARGAEFRGVNRWVGHSGGRALTVWAGRSGQDASLGRVLVADAGRADAVVDLPGAGALRVVAARGTVLELIDEHGARHRFDAVARTFS